jgi:hypothetical protein
MNKLDGFIIVFGLDLRLSAPKFVYAGLVVDLDEAVGTGDIGIEHEDHVDGVRMDLLGLRVPEHARIVGLALLDGERHQE